MREFRNEDELLVSSVASKHSGFKPIAARDARVLILGSLPGAISLARGEYYAQPRNGFWQIMGQLFGFSFESPYRQRLDTLKTLRIAIWDVCAAAHRAGSLDSAISNATANDFVRFLRAHRDIRLIAFNGAKAAQLYRRLVMPHLPAPLAQIHQLVLPSTSPALAAMRFEEKRKRWKTIAAVAASGGRR